MSLIKRRWIIVGIAAAVAASLPVAILAPHAMLVPEEPSFSASNEVNLPAPVRVVVAASAPLFAPERLPPDVVGVTAAKQGPNEKSSPLPSSPLPTLVGVAIHERGNAIALVRGNDGQTLMLRQGEQIDGWTLAGVSGSAVTFKRGDESQKATLDFADKGPSRSAVPKEPPLSVPNPANPTGSSF